MTELGFSSSGSGPAVVLLHGIGCSRHVWDPVIPLLADHARVLAVDLPGFGESAALPPDTEASARALAGSVAEFLQTHGVTAPHVAGNSLGGWVALELARHMPVASLTLLSPAGLWRARTPFYTRASLRVSRWLAVHARGALNAAVGTRAGRVLVLGQSHGRPARMTPQQARTTVAALADGPGFDATLAATTSTCYGASDEPDSPIADPPIHDTPITVAFGEKDRILLAGQSRHIEKLPPNVQVLPLPGCGHIPTFDNPAMIADMILSSVRLGRPSAVDR